MTEFIIPLTAAAAVDAESVGPKAANLAALAQAGLPTPGGFCLSADAYRAQIATLGLGPMVRRFAAAAVVEERRVAVEIRVALYEQPIAPQILAPLLAAWRNARKTSEGPSAVRSSALIEDRKGSNFAGQFESFLGIDDEAALLTAVRACWAALWTTTARRGMANPARSPADTAMAVLIQPLVDARASGGGLSETASGGMLISATWGLGSAIAQGEVVPDRIVLSRQGFLRKVDAGRKHHRESCGHGAGAMPQAVPRELVKGPRVDPPPARAPRRDLAQGQKVQRAAGRDRMSARPSGLQALAGAPAHRRADHRCRRDLAQASRSQRTPGGHRLGRRPRGGGELRVRVDAGCARRRAGHAHRQPGAEPRAAARSWPGR